MRGNHIAKHNHNHGGWSIPAYAGEPQPAPDPGTEDEVYPRVCGGTLSALLTCPAWSGLSPRMRGNPYTIPDSGVGSGSIPAYAGEPKAPRPPAGRSGVYPRVCGGTEPGKPGLCFINGLSPRMRGNPGRGKEVQRVERSIPAYAGEPQHELGRVGACEVYPRVCGGTFYCLAHPAYDQGLSPRMRGNPNHPGPMQGRQRSIPAYAGEPQAVGLPSGVEEVYPRVCGGTPRPGPDPADD